jgi:uncharacterized membrane protein
MEEIVLIAIAFGILALAGVGMLLGWIAFFRSRHAKQRIERLEARLRVLESRATAEARAPLASATLTQPAAARAPELPREPPPRPASPVAPPPPLRSPQPVAALDTAWSSVAPDKTPPVTPPAPRKPKFELERWVGVRGAAVLGGVFLIIAGFLFLQYSIERNWVTPEVRLTVGAIAGLSSILAGFVLRKRGYTVLANSVCGAGVVLLYAVAWAAHVVYGRIEFLSAFAAMVAVTTFCAWLSYRNSSQLVAVLGFVGGFATPLVLSSVQERPLGLFGYALLIDLAFLFVAHRRRWPSIAIIGMLGTFFLQGLWAVVHLDVQRLPIALGALAVFGLVFAVFAARQPSGERMRWIPAQAGALLLPFGFVVYFAQAAELGFHLAPLAALAAVMAIACGVIARLQKLPWLSIGAATGALALVFVWSARNSPDLGLGRAWELSISAVVISAIFCAFAEYAARRDAADRSALPAASVSLLG